MNVGQQVFIINLKDLGRTGVGARGDEELLAVDEQNTIAREFAQTHFRARKIRKYSDRLSNLRGNSTNPVVPLERKIKRLMRKVDASNIHTRLNETLEDTRIVRGWAD
jgi:hypothetical protein